MSDEKQEQPQNTEPPKIKLNGNGKKHTDKIPTVPQAVPPKIKLETTRIQLDAVPGGVPLTPEEGESLKQSTLRIDLPGSDIIETAPTERAASPSAPLKQTSYIHLPEAPTEGAPAPKKTTARIELSDTVAPTAPTVVKKDTKRVQLPDTVSDQPVTVKKQTSKIELATTAAESQQAKKSTARIDLGDAIGIGKAAPEPVAPGARQIPRTVRIKQPEMPPTVALKKPPVGVTAEAAPGEVRKSETARIELPPETIVEQPVTRRKTIRIKRPGAEEEEPTLARAPITVARAAPEAAAQPTAEPEAVAAEAAEEPGIVFTLCAMAAVLVVGMLVYVLAAQTIAPNLPFPGKI